MTDKIVYSSKRSQRMNKRSTTFKNLTKPDKPTGFEDMEDRKAVCKRCHTVMDDCESMSPRGEFNHKKTFADGTKNPCPNANKTFYEGDAEIEPFMRKAERRTVKRARNLSAR